MPFLKTVPEAYPVATGIELLCLPAPHFKRAALEIHFDRPLDGDSPARTLLARVLEHGTRPHPSRRALVCALEELYGAEVELDGARLAEMHRISVDLSWVGERFLPAGEDIVAGVMRLAREVLEDPLRGTGEEPFPRETLERERAQLIRQIRSMVDDRAAYAAERFLAELCAGEPYGRAPYGSEDEVAALEASDLERVRQDLLTVAPITLFAIGPIDAERMAAAVRAWLGDRGGVKQEPPAPVRKSAGELRVQHERLPVDQARFHLGFRFPAFEDAAGFEALSLANAVLGGGVSGRLFRIVREERSLAYGIGSSLHSLKGLLTVSAGIDASSYEGVRDEVLHQVGLLARGDANAEELEVAKAGILNDLQAIGDSNQGLTRFHARERLLGFERSPADRAAQVAAVPLEAIAEAAARLQADLVYLLAPEDALVEAS